MENGRYKMSQERVIDVIDHARDFYSQLSKYHDGLSVVTDQERVKIFLDYLSENIEGASSAVNSAQNSEIN